MAGPKLARGGWGYTPPSQYYTDNTKHGNYQLITIGDIIKNFNASYVGEGKILQKVLDSDVYFHAHRAMQELSYDTFKSCKSQEIVLSPSLQMILPHDYVNYTKITYSYSAGRHTSNPNTVQQDVDGNYVFSQSNSSGPQGQAKLVSDDYNKSSRPGFMLQDAFGISWGLNTLTASYSGPFRLNQNFQYFNEDEFGNFLGSGQVMTEPVLKDGMQIFHPGFEQNTKITNVVLVNNGGLNLTTEFFIDKPTLANQGAYTNGVPRFVSFDDITGGTTWGKYKGSGALTNEDTDLFSNSSGGRFGLNAEFAQGNGSFFIDCDSGKIHFSSNLSGKTIILHYLSDHAGDTSEMRIPKLAEEAMYKWIAYGCASARVDVGEGVIQRLKKERFAETRKAKIRLSNIKLEEISQVLRGKSKFIQH